jgi:uncharacterized protein with PIN domain
LSTQTLLVDFSEAKKEADKIHYCLLCSKELKHIKDEALRSSFGNHVLTWTIYYRCASCKLNYKIIPKDYGHFWMNVRREDES